VEANDHGALIVYQEAFPERSGGGQARGIQAAAATGLSPSGSRAGARSSHGLLYPHSDWPTRAVLRVACWSSLTTSTAPCFSTRVERRGEPGTSRLTSNLLFSRSVRGRGRNGAAQELRRGDVPPAPCRLLHRRSSSLGWASPSLRSVHALILQLWTSYGRLVFDCFCF
jgi:hypothetical protein